MTKTVDYYKVVAYRDISGLENSVNAAITMGWQPYGPMVVTPTAFVQPMVKYARPDDFGPM